MRRRRPAGALLLAAFLSVAVCGAAAAPTKRFHRLKLPPKPALPRSLSVDETEYVLNASRSVVSSGRVKISVYNRGMDDHDLVVYDTARTELAKSILAPGASDQITVTLPAGQYQVVCSLFPGTPVSHETLGMTFTLRVEDPPAAPLRVLPLRR